MENQATDRAFRIGQTRNVQVHKFLCAGTLEEKIDEMIERKIAAIALEAGLVMVSDDTHFRHVPGLRLENWFE